MTTELQKVETALTEFQAIEAGLGALRNQYANVVYPVTTAIGMKEAIAARRAIRDPRIATEKVRKEAKAPILALGKQLDEKAKYITEELLKIEGPIDAQIKIEETRKEQAIYDENMRVIRIKEKINDLGLLVPKMAGQSVAEITKQITFLQDHDLTEWAEEFIVDAEKTRDQTVQALQRIRDGAIVQEKAKAEEAAKIAAERAELEALRAAAAERERAEKARVAAEQAERDAANKAAREAIEQAERESRARIQAETDRLTAERMAVEASQRKVREEAEAKVRAERDAKELAERQARELEEARQREAQRQQNELLDARAMLNTFKARFGHRKEFAGVIQAIDALRRKVAA